MISAICVSHFSRFGLLQRAILNFADQDYPNKELIIAVNQEGYSDIIDAFIDEQQLTNVKVLLFKFTNTVEAAQKAIMHAGGQVIVCWDDDNQSSPLRLKAQLQHLQTTGVPSFITKTLYYFHDSSEIFFTDHAQPTGLASDRCAAASAMFFRTSFPLNLSSNGNDLPWAVAMLLELSKSSSYSFMTNSLGLFLVGSNGDNWRGEELHRRLASNLPGTIKRDSLIENKVGYEKLISFFKFSAGELFVCGKDAQAFSYMVLDNQMFPAGLATELPPEDWKERIPGLTYKVYADSDRRHQAEQRQKQREAAKLKQLETPTA